MTKTPISEEEPSGPRKEIETRTKQAAREITILVIRRLLAYALLAVLIIIASSAIGILGYRHGGQWWGIPLIMGILLPLQGAILVVYKKSNVVAWVCLWFGTLLLLICATNAWANGGNFYQKMNNSELCFALWFVLFFLLPGRILSPPLLDRIKKLLHW